MSIAIGHSSHGLVVSRIHTTRLANLLEILKDLLYCDVFESFLVELLGHLYLGDNRHRRLGFVVVSPVVRIAIRIGHAKVVRIAVRLDATH